MNLFQASQRFISNRKTEIQGAIILLVAAYFCALSLNLFLAYWFLPLEIELSDRAIASRLDLNARDFEIRQVRQRNLFDSSAKEAKPEEPQKPQIDSSQLVKSTINAELLGTIVFQNSRYSVALLADKSSNRSSYYAVNDQIQNARVARIERFRVIFQRSGRMEYLEVTGNEMNLKSSRTTPPSRRGTSSSSQGIRQKTDDEFEIDGSFLDQQLNDLPALLRGALAQPVTNNGQIDGFRITQIRSGSVYDQLGLENGDVIKAVNGDELNSPQKGMQLFSTLRNQKRISIDIERGGSRLNYTYDIR